MMGFLKKVGAVSGSTGVMVAQGLGFGPVREPAGQAQAQQ
jgi:hypothetical protein